MRGENDGLEKARPVASTPPIAAGAASAQVPSEPRVNRTERRALIIEDNIDASETLREILQFGAYLVDVAYTGRDGLNKARTFQPDIVLCDIGLPDMDGYAVARAIRADPALDHLPLLALTGYAEPEDVARARDAGFDAHLVKPPDIQALLQMLERLQADPGRAP